MHNFLQSTIFVSLFVLRMCLAWGSSSLSNIRPPMFGSRVVRMIRATDSHVLNIEGRKPLNDIGGDRR